mmetsp:Transcript_1099/g.3400  ORF Transcript_1099/g.3400 Transcript_1099/m.3400 type:complete len:324 (-) Transcript_1099:520-1491(-)
MARQAIYAVSGDDQELSNLLDSSSGMPFRLRSPERNSGLSRKATLAGMSLISVCLMYNLTGFDEMATAPSLPEQGPLPGTPEFTHSAVRFLDDRAFSHMLDTTGTGSRGRLNFNFHAADDDLQAFVNAWVCGSRGKPCSYVQPHAHREPETVTVVQGELAYFLFENATLRPPLASGLTWEDHGPWPTSCHILTPHAGGARGIFVKAGVWHSMAAYYHEPWSRARGPWRGKGEALVWEVKLKQPGAYTVAANKRWLPGSVPEAFLLRQAAQASTQPRQHGRGSTASESQETPGKAELEAAREEEALKAERRGDEALRAWMRHLC